MARLRRQRSRLLDKARLRAATLANLDPDLSFATISLRQLNEQILRAQAALDQYNRLIAETDAAKHAFEREEAAANELAVRLLLGVRSRHGKHSAEYQAAGGRPPTRPPQTPPRRSGVRGRSRNMPSPRGSPVLNRRRRTENVPRFWSVVPPNSSAVPSMSSGVPPNSSAVPIFCSVVPRTRSVVLQMWSVVPRF